MGRGLFVKYRFTDRRISCITSAPWQSEPLTISGCGWHVTSASVGCGDCRGDAGAVAQAIPLATAGANALPALPLRPTADEQLDAAYEEVKAVTSIGRGVGAWGDMVVTLNDGSKIEMRSLPR